MGRILVADDEHNVRSSFEKLLGKRGHEVLTASRAEAVLPILEEGAPDLVIMDIRTPGLSGLEVLETLRQSHPKMPVIMMTGFGDMEAAVRATRLGAFDYHVKPFDPAEMLRSVEAALESGRLMRESVAVNPSDPQATDDALIGRSPRMQEVYKAIGKVADTDATVLIRGETGTGKELVARAVYQYSRRSERPLVVLNCTAIPETLLESELFGYEKGAFTGAASRRIGKFEQADGGTIFLDEIGDVPLGVQAKILRVLQERSFERLGGHQTISVDVRVIAATNRKLEKAIAEGRFREDLYHRLNVFTVKLPPLRERGEDLASLAAYFLARFARQLDVERPVLTEGAMRALKSHAWLGNVRELEHCIHRVVISTKGYPIQPDDILRALEVEGAPSAPELGGTDEEKLRALVVKHLQRSQGAATHTSFLEAADKLLVAEALRLTGGNQTRAAKLLGLTRPTLQAKMQKHSLRMGTAAPTD